MSIVLLQTLARVSYIFAVIFLLTAIVLFFLLKVPKLIGDITGSTARKEIELIKQQNENGRDKAYKPNADNAPRGKITDEISLSGKLKRRVNRMGIGASAKKTVKAKFTLASSATPVSSVTSGETTILDENGPAAETTVLAQDQSGQTTAIQDKKNQINIDVEMGYTSSSEIIE